MQRALRSAALSAGLIAGLFSSIEPALYAQSGSGSIQGTVSDSSGGVIPQASVNVINIGTGASVQTSTNGAGFYSIPSLFAGNYTVTFAAPGLKKYETTLTLQVAQVATINPQMSAGAVTEQVTVQGNTVQLATYDSGTISSTLDNARLSELPVNGRFLLSLAGVTTPGLEGGGQRANGNMGEALEYVQDGAPLVNRNFGGAGNSTQAQLPDPDAVQEVRIETTNSNARFSTPATGIITTKSGTNRFHGSLFETARNNAIGIAKVRQNPADYAAPHYVRNEFGGSIGGPIDIPKIYDGHDRSFFFFAYERYSLRSFSSELVTVPMVNWRAGDFSNLTNASGVLLKIYDPTTTDPVTGQRQQFAGNKIDPSRMSPLAQKLMAITPLPTSNDNPLVAPNLNTAGINNATIPQYNFRIDHTLNERNRAFLRFTSINQDQASLRNYPSNSAASIAGAGLPAGATGLQQILVTTVSSALGYTHVFSPTFVSETNVAQQWFNQYFVGGGQPNLNYEQMLGLPNNFGQVGFPNISGGSMPYGGTQFNYKEAQIITNVDQNFNKIVGRHQLLFGGRYRHERFGYLPDRGSDSISFGAYASANLDPSSGANYTGLQNTGNANADLFLGAAYSYSVYRNAPYGHYRDQEIDSYFQDDFHVNKNLTLNAGVRWEIHPGPYTKDGLTQSFDLKNKAIVLQYPTDYYIQKGYTTQSIVTNLTQLGVKFETPEVAGIPQTMLFDYNFTFSPRIGFAYTPFNGRHGTVIRAGFGRFIYPVPIRNSLKLPIANAPFTASYSTSYTTSNQSPDGLPNYLLRKPQAVVAGLNSTNVIDSSSITSIQPGVTLTTLDPHYPPAYVTQLNFTIEQPVKFNTVLRVTYLYDHGTNLDQNWYYNNHPSTYVWEAVNGVVPPTGQYSNTATGPYDQTTYGGGAVLSQKSGYSNDNALQINAQRLFKNGYAFQVYWVYSQAFRVGGNTFRDSQLYPAANFLPSVLPSSDPGELNRFQNYQLDTAIPRHHIAFNGLVDLPFGKGKAVFGNANRFWNALIGGFQVAGLGEVVSQSFQVASGNWGPTNPIHAYRDSKHITDCRSGVCRKANLWFNGYIAPSSINTATNGVSGLPSDYVPYQVPINNVPGTTNYGNNNVPLKLKDGSTVQVAYSPGPKGVNRYSKTFLQGPMNYRADLSLFKVFAITEAVKLRINFDAFNAFNIQGYNNPNTTDGTQNFLNSYWSGRQIQLTARLTF
ncbi:MAG: carboxypeptidase-like regulatory domain-containing protein [Edaphobacter sp.]|nr:carboxypeptidase-like regulatory domain-containing protein [Edaphobacter sp.]MDE1175841.1 carboxypeptidase-like regulatory domain-containing protein [Edaphobacter sp.]